MKELYIVNVHNKFHWFEPFSYLYAAVRFFTNSNWNHTALLIKDHMDEYYAVEMTTKGIKRSVDLLDWSDDKYIAIFKPKFKINMHDTEILIRLTTELRLKYDYRGTGWYQLVYAVGKWMNRKLGTHIKWMGFTDAGRATERFYCSEYVGWVFNKASGNFRDWYKLSPEDIFEHRDIQKFKMIFAGRAATFYIKAL